MPIKPPHLLLLISSVASVSPAEDWPTYMHDESRSGVSQERLSFPLNNLWNLIPSAPPQPAWPEPGLGELPKLGFDDAFHVSMVGETVYFGSPIDNGIHAINVKTGKPRWTFFTEGAVRVAPTIADGFVYAGSDDGAIYCLTTASGEKMWSTRPFDGSTRIIGAGKVMSLWPIRMGLVARGDRVFCGAGLFPTSGTAVLALNAVDGSVAWKTSEVPRSSYATLVPQGYPTVTGDKIFVPCGRSTPISYIMADGTCGNPIDKSYATVRKKGVISGGYGVVVDNGIYVGTQNELHGYNPEGKHQTVWADTRQIIATDEGFFRLVGQNPTDRKTDSAGKTDTVAALDRSAPREPPRWAFRASGLQKMIAAGPHLIVGGRNEIFALDGSTGKKLWSGKVDGLARGLAVANGHLVVSTDNGSIHCFGAGDTFSDPPAPGAIEIGEDVATLARAIVDDSRANAGFGLVLGPGSAELAVKLAELTDLRMHIAETDPQEASSVRAQLLEAGIYGNEVVVDVLPPENDVLPYPPYFANLVVATGATRASRTQLAELLRVLKPCGGVLYSAEPADGKAFGDTGTVTQVRLTPGDTWTKMVRSPLPGARNWTHQYADAGNTGSSDDALIRGHQRVLWYGGPGAGKVQDRHRRSEAPLCLDGRVFLQGFSAQDDKTLLLSFDAYNGVSYWEREIPGAERIYIVNDCGNLAASRDGLFVALGERCEKLDLVTGVTESTYPVPTSGGETNRNWAYLAVNEKILVGSVSSGYQFSSSIFAYDIRAGKLKWHYRGNVIRNSTIAISGGKLFFVEHRGDAQAPHVLNPLERAQEARSRAKRRGKEVPRKPAPDVPIRTVVALDLQTGDEIWAKDEDFTGCGDWTYNLCGIAKNEVVFFCGVHSAYGRENGSENERRALALSAIDGERIWNEAIGNRVRPIVVGDRITGRPNAFYLSSGKPVLKEGGAYPWTTPSSGACGQMSASAGLIFFRHGQTVAVNAKTGKRIMSFTGMRPGCLINVIPAGGVVLQVEASSGCKCYHALQGTVAFVPATTK